VGGSVGASVGASEGGLVSLCGRLPWPTMRKWRPAAPKRK
jgi:hypothetical protein